MATVQLTDLIPDKFYAVQIRAVSEKETSVWGSVFVFKTEKDTVAPAKVMGLVGQPSGTTFIASWQRPTTNSDGTPLLDLSDYEVTVSAQTTMGPISGKFIVQLEKFELSLEQNKNLFAEFNDTYAAGEVTITVRARDKVGNKSEPAEITIANDPPAAPTNVKMEALPGAISLRWDPNTEADFERYEVFVGSTASFTRSAANRVYRGPGNSFIYRTGTVAPHYFIIRAIDVVNSGADTSAGPITPVDYFAVDTSAPSVPIPTVTTALDTTDPSRTQATITVTWPSVTGQDVEGRNDVSGFKVRYGTTINGPWTYIDVDETVRSALIPNLNFNTPYYVGVQAYDYQANYSSFGNANLYPITTPTDPKPATVLSSTITATGGLTTLTVSWTPLTAANVKNYDVEIDTVNTFNSADLRSATVTGKLTTFANLKMINPNTGASYFIRVRARNMSDVTGDWAVAPGTFNSGTAVSTKSDGAPPSAHPTGVSCVSLVQSLEVKWNSVTNADPVTYEIHAGLPGFTPDPVNKTTRIAETTGNTYLLRTLPGQTTPLAYDTTYAVRVYAKDVDGMAAYTSSNPPQATGKTLFTTTSDINFVARDIGSLKIFRQATRPTVAVDNNNQPFITGDLWYHSGENNNLYRYDSTQPTVNAGWIDIHDGDIDAAASAAGLAHNAARDAQSTADARITTFYQNTVPTSLAVGDLWVHTGDRNKPYRALSKGATTINNAANPTTGWVIITDTDVKKALDDAFAAHQAANLAQGTANNRNTTYYQQSMPTTPANGTVFTVGDIWFDTDDGYRMYYYNGSTFFPTQWGTNTFADYSISGVKIIGGSVTAEKLSQVAFSDQAVPNGSFEDLRVQSISADQPAGLPARWLFDVTASGYVGATYASDTSPARGGARSVRLTNAANAGARIYNVDIIPVAAGESWYLGFQTYAATATTGSAVELVAYWYNNAGTYVGANSLKLADAGPTWQRVEEQVIVPSNAAGMRIGIVLRSSATSRSINVDMAEVRRVTTQVMIGNGAVNAEKVETNSLKAKNFEVGAITADKISVGTLGTILVANGSFESLDQDGVRPAGWTNVNGTGTFDRFTLASSPSGDNVLRITSSPLAVGSRAFAVKPGSFYNFRSKVMHTTGSGNYYIRIEYMADYPSSGFVTSATRSGFVNIVDNASVAGITSWTQSDFTWQVPAGVYWATYSFYNWGTNTGSLYVDDVQVQEQLVGTQIAQGTITTGHIVTAGLSATTITTDTLNADRIGTNTVDADKIKANTAFAQNLFIDSTIVMGPDTQPAITNSSGKPEIRSSNYTGTTGWRLSQDGLDIKSGTINARSLLLQDSQNILPPEIAGADMNPLNYVQGGYITWGTDGTVATTGGVSSQYARNGIQSFFYTKPNNTGTYTWFGFSRDASTTGSGVNTLLEPNTDYLFSFYVRIPAGAAGAIKHVRMRNQVGTDLIMYTRTSAPDQVVPPAPAPAPAELTNVAVPVSTTWQRVEGWFRTDAATTAGWIFLAVSDTAATTYYFDSLQLEKVQTGSYAPSTFKPPSSTRIDGGAIRTGLIRSSNTLPVGHVRAGQPYWSIDTSGDAVFNSARINGLLVVGENNVATGGGTAVQSWNYRPGLEGWAIKADGSVDFQDGAFRGNITGATGTFSGKLNVNNKFFVGQNGDMWIGNAKYDDAIFRVSQSGALVASSATIRGDITATAVGTTGLTINQDGSISTTSGLFTVSATGVLSATKANILGSLQVGGTNASGEYVGYSLYMNANGLTIGSDSASSEAPFYVDTSGRMWANSGFFTGTIKSTAIEAGTMTAGTFSTNYSSVNRAVLGPNSTMDYNSMAAVNFHSANSSTGSGIAGDSDNMFLYSAGGRNCRIHLSSEAGVAGQIGFFTGDGEIINVNTGGLAIGSEYSLSLGLSTSQRINLYGTDYGIGVADNILWMRTNSDFYVLKGGGFGSGTTLYRVDSSGSMFTAGDIYAGGTGKNRTVYGINGLTASSALRFKTDVSDIESPALDALSKLRPVTYYYTEEVTNVTDRLRGGFIAEEVEQIEELKHLVGYNEDGEVFDLDYQSMTPYLVKAITELRAEVKALRSQLTKN